MRSDFSKLLVERPRLSAYDSGEHLFDNDFKFVRNQGWDEELDNDDVKAYPSSLRRPHRTYTGGKQLNENLAPLRRFLASQVGKSWNSVYSDIRKNINPNNAIQMHVLQHLEDYVKPHDFIKGEYSSSSMFLIDKDGILRERLGRYQTEAERKKIYEDKKPKQFIFGSNKEYPDYAFLHGTWYKCTWVSKQFFWEYRIKVSKIAKEFNDIIIEWKKPARPFRVYNPETKKVEDEIFTTHSYFKNYRNPSSPKDSGDSWVYYTIPRFRSLTRKELKDFKRQFHSELERK